jgi:basic membrane lipoprotein Med (substrate-binding protein (PBP1-ABC) superfamily)
MRRIIGVTTGTNAGDTEDERNDAMKIMRLMATALVAAGLVAGSSAFAQTPGTQTSTMETSSTTTTTQPAPTWTAEQLITSSVHDAWVMSGKNEQVFFEMVTQLAQISAQKRGLTLPDSEDAGKRFGQLVKDMAKADHDQLLYVGVDKAVQQVATKS